jgi:hypothetical protein
VKIDSYIDMASKWPCEKNHALTYSISAGVLWGFWLTRNDFVFNHQVWRDVKVVPSMHGGLETDISRGTGARYGTVAHLLGGGPQDSSGDHILVKLKQGD